MTLSCWLRRRLTFGSEKTLRYRMCYDSVFFCSGLKPVYSVQTTALFKLIPTDPLRVCIVQPLHQPEVGHVGRPLHPLRNNCNQAVLQQHDRSASFSIYGWICSTQRLNCNSPPGGGPSVSPRQTDLVRLAQECCYHSNLPVAAYGVIVLVNITVSCPDKGQLWRVSDQIADGFYLLLGCND